MKKLFVLDTSVLLYNHDCITSFEENDVAIPITVLEELDKFKVGNDTLNFEAREVSRFIDNISLETNLNQWISLPGENKGLFKILMYINNGDSEVEKIFGSSKNDHKILNAAVELQKEFPNRNVILITKDIILFVKDLA